MINSSERFVWIVRSKYAINDYGSDIVCFDNEYSAVDCCDYCRRKYKDDTPVIEKYPLCVYFDYEREEESDEVLG